MVLEGVAAGGRHGVQLVIRQLLSEMAARGTAGAKELVIRIIHLIGLEHGLEATLIEGTVVGHQGQSGDARGDLSPHFREGRGAVGVFRSQTVHFLTEPCVVVGHGMDETVESVGDNAVAHDHHADAAHAAALSVGGLEINSCEVFHTSLFDAGISVGKGTSFFGGKNRARV